MIVDGNDVNVVVNTLCEKFGTTAEFLIPEVAKYKVSTSFAKVVSLYILLIIFFIGLKKCFEKITKEMDIPKHEPFEYTTCIIILAGVCAFIISEMYWLLLEFVGWMASPYGAMISLVLESMK